VLVPFAFILADWCAVLQSSNNPCIITSSNIDQPRLQWAKQTAPMILYDNPLTEQGTHCRWSRTLAAKMKHKISEAQHINIYTLATIVEDRFTSNDSKASEVSNVQFHSTVISPYIKPSPFTDSHTSAIFKTLD